MNRKGEEMRKYLHWLHQIGKILAPCADHPPPLNPYTFKAHNPSPIPIVAPLSTPSTIKCEHGP